MQQTRQVSMLKETGEIQVITEEIPELKTGDILVEVKASLISPGTEGSVIARRKENSGQAEVTPIGYQNAGIVVETGADVSGYIAGDRVACMGSGFAVHADYAVVPCNLCTRLPNALSYEEGAFNHLAATALQALRRAELQLGENVVVMGLGIVGQITAQLARLAGCHVLAFDMLQGRVEIARKIGLENAYVLNNIDPVAAAEEVSRGYGIDSSFICFGGEATGALETILEMAKEAPDGHKMGRVVIVGGAHISQSFPTALGNMDIRASSRTGPGYHDADYEQGQDYAETFVRWNTQRNLEEVIGWMESGELEVESLITDHYPLAEVNKAYSDLMNNREDMLGVILQP